MASGAGAWARRGRLGAEVAARVRAAGFRLAFLAMVRSQVSVRGPVEWACSL